MSGIEVRLRVHLRTLGILLLFLLIGTSVARADGSAAGSTPTPVPVPTVAVPATPVAVPTVALPPTATPSPTPRPTPRPTRVPRPRWHRTWIWAYLTSYCPSSAGWLSSSGLTVFYGMLANNFYPFGTRVYMPVLGIVGIVYDRDADYATWNHFDVWSPVCYSTPTGWFKVAVLERW